jgi:protein phosphatase
MSGLQMMGKSDTGMVRDHNEDCFLVVPDSGLAILADGMGGHLAGEVASAMAIDQVTHYLLKAFSVSPANTSGATSNTSYESQKLTEAIQTANAAIHDASRNRPEQAGMGTTIVVAAFHGNKLTVAHVGDSRLYRYRHDELSLVTEDHSMVQELLRRGLMTPDEARTSLNRNLVTRALGIDPTVEVDVLEQQYEAGDLFLLCSDGLNDVLTDDEIAAVLNRNAGDLESTAQQLIADVNARGGPDNVSIVLIQADGKFSRPLKK